MTADEQHSNSDDTDTRTTTVASQDDATQHVGTARNTSQTRMEQASEQGGDPPSFTPKDTTRTRPATQGTHAPGSGARSHTGAARHRRPWWQVTVLMVFVACAVVAALYANGTIWGTPRAQAMSACRKATARAQDAHRLTQTAIDDAKQYRDDASKTIDADALRRMTVLIDDAEKEPAVPSCTITMDNARLNDHAETAKQLTDVYTTITKELVRITSGVTDNEDAGAAQDTTSGEPPTPSGETEPERPPTATPSASATASAQPSASPSSTPKDSASSTARPTAKPSGSASPSTSANPSPSATATASPSANPDGNKR